METLDNLADIESSLEQAKYDFLKQQGWKYGCDNPTSRWFWEKQLPDGRVCLLSQDDAIQMEAYLSPV